MPESLYHFNFHESNRWRFRFCFLLLLILFLEIFFYLYLINSFDLLYQKVKEQYLQRENEERLAFLRSIYNRTTFSSSFNSSVNNGSHRSGGK